jgi:sugar phosphate isomerase/epimerase
VLNTASQAVEMCKRIGAPNVKTHLDVYHMNIEESDIRQAILETGGYATHRTVGDVERPESFRAPRRDLPRRSTQEKATAAQSRSWAKT